MNERTPAPLAGIRVVDMTSVLLGPYATQTLGDYGADVIKVEPPDGDVVRRLGPARHPGMGPVFLNVNRNKRSVVLDLKAAADLAAMKRLLASADVFVTNVRPLAMARLGLDYDAIALSNPRLVYAAVVGYAQTGPYAHRPAYDDLIQGGATLAHLSAQASQGEPRYAPNAIADRFVGMSAVGAVLATLLARERTGRGQQVEIPMFETMVSMILGDHLGGLTFEPPLDQGGYARHLSPDRRPYRTRDGYVCALVYNDKQWDRFLTAIGRVDLLTGDPRFATFESRSKHVDIVYAELARIFLTRTTDQWLALLDAADVPFMPMHDLQSILSDPHLVATGFFSLLEHPSEGLVRRTAVPITWSDSGAAEDRPAPRLGEHTNEVMREIGMTDEEIHRLSWGVGPAVDMARLR